MMSLTDDKQIVIIEAFNSTFKYLDDLLNIDYPYHEGLVTQIYPTELQLNANSTDTEAAFLDLQLLTSNGFVSYKIITNARSFSFTLFDIVNFSFSFGDVPHISLKVFTFLSFPASILRKSTSGRHRPVSYPDGPMTARYRFT